MASIIPYGLSIVERIMVLFSEVVGVQTVSYLEKVIVLAAEMPVMSNLISSSDTGL